MFFSYGSIWKYFRVFKDAHTHTERERVTNQSMNQRSDVVSLF